jgi:hypothetical protein
MVDLELLAKSAPTICRMRDGRLVVVSNRVALPSSTSAPAAGGLAVAMNSVLKRCGGLWFGWSGRTSEEGSPEPQCRTSADALARAFMMPLDERKHRWQAMMAVLRANSVHDWASHFLEALDVERKSFDRPVAESSVSNAAGVARPEPSTVARRARSALPKASSQRRPTNGTTQPLSKAPRRTPPLRPNGSAIALPHRHNRNSNGLVSPQGNHPQGAALVGTKCSLRN